MGGLTDALNLSYYPATLVLYTAGLGMVLDSRLVELENILRTTTPIHTSNKPGPFCSELSAVRALSFMGSEKDASQHVFDLIAPIVSAQLLVSDESVREAFDRLELLMVLIGVYSRSNPELEIRFTSPGIIRRVGNMYAGVARPVSDLEALRVGGVHPWIALGLFNGDQEKFEEMLGMFNSAFATRSMYPGNY
jgi:hypothetical protein